MGLPVDPQSDPQFAAALDAMKGQLLICMVNRLGGSLTLPVAEVDQTGSWMLHIAADPAGRTFTFTTTRKS